MGTCPGQYGRYVLRNLRISAISRLRCAFSDCVEQIHSSYIICTYIMFMCKYGIHTVLDVMNEICDLHWVNVLCEFGNLLEDGVYLICCGLHRIPVILKP